MKKTFLITGVAGLLGSRLSDFIIENYPNSKVVGIDDLSGGYIENINPKVKFYKKNLATDPIETCFERHNPDYVFHFAAYAAEGLSPFIRKFNYTNNLISTSSIINQCIKHNVKRLVFTSSMAVYGHGEGGIFHENMIRRPIDPYGIAKMSCERDIEIANEQHGLDYTIIRPHNVYGIKQNIWDKYRNVLGIWMYYLMNDKPLTIFGDGTQRRAFSYIDDSLPALFRSSIEPKASKQIINLGGIYDYSIDEAADILIKVAGFGNKIYLEKRHEVHIAVPTWKKSIDILGFRHEHELEVGLKKMWDWAVKQPERERFEWDNFELDKGIYKFWKK